MNGRNICYNCFRELEHPGAPCPHCGFDLAENEAKFPLALRAGTVLDGRYVIGRVLGQGGFGITYLAMDTQLDARVAIKEFMPSELATRDGSTVTCYAGTKTEEFTYGAERFQEEAKTLAKFLGNPNIAGVSSYFDENGTSYFVMDYIEGISFKSYIAARGGQVSVEDTMNVMIPVLRALTAVHAEGFIHRDVTPDNIYITKTGEVKLLDFGSARYSIGDKSKSLDVILKVGYAPKEQYIRRSRQGPYTDVYSCAACCYAAITGYVPPEALERLDQDELVPISQMGIDIPPYLENAILKGLAVQPEDRFQSAAEFLDAIESQRVVQVPAGRGAAAPAPREEKKKPRTIIAAAVAAVLTLVLGVGLFSGGGGGGGDHRPLKRAAVSAITIDGEEFSTDLRELDLRDRGLTDEDVQDLKYMINLDYLNLRGNDITDLSFLEDMDLYTLQLGDGNNDIADLTPIMTQEHLDYLSLSEAIRPVDLSPLSGLTTLTGLAFDGRGGDNTGWIEDLSFLTDLTGLRELWMSVGGVKSLAPLAGMTELKTLGIWGSMQIHDLSPLSGLTELTNLQLAVNGSLGGGVMTKDLTALKDLTKLTELRLSIMQPVSLHGLENMTEMLTLGIYHNGRSIPCQDLSALSGMTKLTSLNVGVSGGESFQWLSGLTKLRELSLYGDGVMNAPDLTMFSGLTELESLHLNLDGVKNLRGLENLTGLKELRMYGGGATFTDTSPLSGLTELQSLDLPWVERESGQMDLSGLAKLTRLQELDLGGPFKSLEPLRGLTSLKSVRLSDTDYRGAPLDLSPLGSLTSVTDLDLRVDRSSDLTAVGKMTELRTLQLNMGNYDHPVRDLSPLAGLKNLTSAGLYFSNGENLDWSPVAHVPNLTKN